MGFLEALKLYPKAALWSVMLSTAVVMEGFDVALLASLYGSRTFAEKYGRPGPHGEYLIPAGWEAALSNGSVVGEIVGLIINGYASERYGYRSVSHGTV